MAKHREVRHPFVGATVQLVTTDPTKAHAPRTVDAAIIVQVRSDDIVDLGVFGDDYRRRTMIAAEGKVEKRAGGFSVEFWRWSR